MGSVQTRIKELTALISKADDSYWRTGSGPVPDSKYDQWVEELKVLSSKAESSFGTPTVLSSGKIQHPVPLLSMSKAYILSIISAWAEKTVTRGRLLAMPKYDGIALIKYPNQKVATRGNGYIGEDVTFVTSPFMTQEAPGLGEAVIKNSTFSFLKDSGYKHPRNAVSGILSALDPAIQEKAKYITFARYDQIVVPVNSFSEEDLQSAVTELQERASDYPMDGIVFRIEDESLFQKLGHTNHHWRGQIAFKFQNEVIEVSVVEIFSSCKNGTITPMIRINPIIYSGATISKCSCSNWRKVQELDIRPGDRCNITRMGGTIPVLLATRHTENSSPSPVSAPTHCPICNSPVQFQGARLFCKICEMRSM